MPRMSARRRLQVRLFAVTVTCLFVISTLSALGYLMSQAFRSIAQSADQIDDARALSAANGALRALETQLNGTVRDNAYWDDAYTKVMSDEGAQWAVDTWGSTTSDYPLYDTAMVINADGTPLMAYHDGTALDDSNAFFLGDLKQILVAARRPDPDRNRLPVSFVRTRDGIALIGAAAIQPSAFDPKLDRTALKVLIFSKQMKPKVVDQVSRTFNIDGLMMTDGIGPVGTLHADVTDIAGREIAYLTWPPVRPGTASYERIRPIVIGSGITLVALLAAVCAAGFAAFRSVRNNERAADYKARHDALTGVWNRAGCLDQLEQALSLSSDRSTTLHLLDLDGFKPVNDAWGHAVGDELIKAVAARLVEAMPPATEVARLGGDEFAVVRSGVADTRAATFVADRILTCLSTPFIIGGRTIEVGGSLGMAAGRAGEVDSIELLRRADLALYRAKDMGRGIAVNYDPSLDEDACRTAELEQELRRALAKGEIGVVFQPLIDAASRQVKGVEALARWTSSTRGAISPEVFIGVAERAGLIDQLGFQIMSAAMSEGNRWPDIGVAVNISPLQLKNPYFVDQVRELIASAAFDPRRLTIEVTEGILISNPDQAKRAFAALRDMGVKIALDDFGCGYASIGALREFGFDRMKIDRSLIVALDNDERGAAVLQATIALANALHLPVTAEGIETEEQATVVRLSGCDELQGYLFSRPISASELTERYFSGVGKLVRMS